MAHPVVNEHECGHGLDDRHRTRNHAGIVAPLAHQLGRLALAVDCLLGLENRGGGLEGDVEDQVLAVADAALHPTGAVGRGAHAAVAHFERVIVLGTAQEGARKTAAELKALGGGQRKHCLGQIGLEPVKNRFTEAGWQTTHTALDHAAHGITLTAHTLDALDHGGGGGRVRTTHRRGLDLGQRG